MASARNSSAPHPAHRYTPPSFAKAYGWLNGGSVLCWRSTYGALKEPDRVVLRLVPEKAVAWHYGKGDYTRMQEEESLQVTLPTSSRDGSV
jgi:hypothetical protein